MNDDRLLVAFFLLLAGAVIGAAQLTVFWGFLPENIVPYQRAAGWILITIPVGAFVGVVFTSLFCRFIKLRWELLSLAWFIGCIVGIKPSLIAPLLLGLGPEAHKSALTAFIAQYAILWGLLIWLIFRQNRQNKS